MSTLRFNTWQNTGGTEVANSTLGTGKILQVVQGQRTTTFTTTSTSMVDVTDVSLSITPSSTDSKILVLVTGVGGNANASFGIYMNLVRDSTAIGLATGGTDNYSGMLLTQNTQAAVGFVISHLDSPATTSATTYKLQAKTYNATATAVLGRLAHIDTIRVPTTITAMEVSA